MSTVSIRRPYQGVLQILEFNRRRYLVALICVGLALAAFPHLPPVGRVGLLMFAAPAFFWMASSLAVSHYVYDCFPLYDLRWIPGALSLTPRRWINIHCGFDESSHLLAAIFPNAAGQTVDIFDPRVMTEPSIKQARRAGRGAIGAVRARYCDLGFDANSCDAAFSIFAAHELRRHTERVKLFKEVARILVPGGEFLVMEHIRDWRSFLAFGPGFLHFFSQQTWRRAASHAGLAVRAEFVMTPFVHVFILRRTL